jgi:O-antigen/teichoic acid export membrane protein
MVFMPVLVINLLSTVIFRPLIVDMANLYNDNKLKDYKKIINKQQLYILLIAVVIMPCVYFLGIPVLSAFYDSKLGPYRLILMILMLGGIFSAYSSFINVCIITIRKQNILIIATVIIALIAAGLTEIMVIKFELLGAALSYLIVMILQAVAYLLIHEISLKKKANSLVKE